MNTTRQPFDLEKALKGAKVVTRDGRQISNLVQFAGVKDAYPLAAVLEGAIQRWCANGQYCKDNQGCRDLFLEVFTWPEGYEVHNPAGVTSAGEGWRFLSKEELNTEKDDNTHFWTGSIWFSVNLGSDPDYASHVTYRVPQDHPFPPLPAAKLEFPPLPPGEEWHNPEGRDAEFFGADYRPLTKREVAENAQHHRPRYDRERWNDGMWERNACGCSDWFTYRIPRTVPIPTPPPAPVWVPWSYDNHPQGEVWIKRKDGFQCKFHVGAWGESMAHLGPKGWTSYRDLLQHFTLLDGSPCGTKEEAK